MAKTHEHVERGFVCYDEETQTYCGILHPNGFEAIYCSLYIRDGYSYRGGRRKVDGAFEFFHEIGEPPDPTDFGQPSDGVGLMYEFGCHPLFEHVQIDAEQRWFLPELIGPERMKVLAEAFPDEDLPMPSGLLSQVMEEVRASYAPKPVVKPKKRAKVA